jgi:hypothetical protein
VTLEEAELILGPELSTLAWSISVPPANQWEVDLLVLLLTGPSCGSPVAISDDRPTTDL